MLTPAVMATSISPTCPECGIIKKSGKRSCCGHGGSWFGNCGGAASGHTWHEGIRICKARPLQIPAAQQSHALHPKDSSMLEGVGTSVHFDAAIRAPRAFASVPARISSPKPAVVRTNTSVNMTSRKFIENHSSTTTSQAISATRAKSKHNGSPIDMEMGSPTTTSSVNQRITPSTNSAIIPSANGTRIESTDHAVNGVVMRTLFRTPASASFNAQKCEKFWHVVAFIDVIFTVVCTY